MIGPIGRFERWILEKLFARFVIQSRFHEGNIREVFRMMIVASRREFTEDNDPTLYDFLREQFEHAMDDTLTHHQNMREVYQHASEEK